MSDVTLTSVVSDTQQTASQAITLANDFNDFLTLLTTQLQNQDPLSPMDSTEFTNQLVQFSQVEQSINANQKLDSLVQMQISNLSGMALGFVGMEITYPSIDLNYDGENNTDIIYVFEEAVTDATLTIYDENGALVYDTQVDGGTGTNNFQWDGVNNGGEKVDPGTYTVYVDAFDLNGDSAQAQTVVTGIVHGVETQNGIPYLLVGDRAVEQTTVINAKKVDQTAATTTDTESETDAETETTETDEGDTA